MQNGAAVSGAQTDAPHGTGNALNDGPRVFTFAPQHRALTNSLRRDNVAKMAVPAAAAHHFAQVQTDEADGGQRLDNWLAALAQSVQMPLLGDETGAQQANQALMSARQSGQLDALRARLEAKRSQSPPDIVTARMLAAVDEFGFSEEEALKERRRLVRLTGATGEDWYALALAEERAGNGQAARIDYQRALNAPAPLSSQHAALARQRS